MRWKDVYEKEIIKAWAEEFSREELTGQYFSAFDMEKESYWCEYSQVHDIDEYAFKTVSELEEMLGHALTEEFYQELHLPLAVAAFKERKLLQIERGSMKNCEMSHMGIDEFSIPDFVYQF